MKATGLYPATMLLLLLAGAVSYAATLNVPGGYSTIQMALDAAHNGDVIIVAPGTYSENINFSGKAVVLRSSNPSDWSVVAATVIDGGGSGSVVTFNHGEGAGSQLLGFKVTNGLAAMGGGILCDGASPTIAGNLITGNATTPGADGAEGDIVDGGPGGNGGDGGGICCNGGSATITANHITGNSTGEGGWGGVGEWYYDSSSGDSWGLSGGPGGNGGWGGGVALEGGCGALLSGNVITGNSTGAGGRGGDAGWDGEHMMYGGNGGDGGSGGDGGGVATDYISNPVVSNNVVAGNWTGDGEYPGNGSMAGGYDGIGGSGGSGGGISGGALVQNDTIVGNSYGWDQADVPTTSGAGVFGCVVNSCVIADNGSTTAGGVGYSVDPSAAVSYSDVFGNPIDRVGWKPAGPGNISVDPLFADSAGGDYHLKSKVGRWNGSGWVVDPVQSPCIDAGDPTLPFSNEPGPNGDQVNMGAYGNTAQASKSLRPQLAVQPDMLIQGPDTGWLGSHIYNTTGVGQTTILAVNPGNTGTQQLRVENDGTSVDAFRLTGTPGNGAFSVRYYSAAAGGTDITSQVTGAGWTTPSLSLGQVQEFRAEITVAASTPLGTSLTLAVTATSTNNPTKKDVAKVSVLAPIYKPDLMLRPVQSNSVAFTGENVYNTTGVGQTLSKTTDPGTQTRFFLRVRNNGDAVDDVKITAYSSGRGTWQVTYFDAPSGGTDITASVTGGGWDVTLAPGAAIDFSAEVYPYEWCPGNASCTLNVLATSQGNPAKRDLVKAVTVCNPVYHPNLMLRAVQSDSEPFTGEYAYNTTGVDQTLSKTTNAGAMTPFFLRVRNDGNASDNIKITGPAGSATWQVHYFNAPAGGTDITSQVTGTGWTPKVVVGAAVDFRVEVTPAASCPVNTSCTLSVLATSQGDGTKRDLVKAVTTCVPVFKPDLMLRGVQSSSTPFTGENVYNTTGAGQTLSKATTSGVRTPFFLRMRNNGQSRDTICITADPGSAQWTVRYFDAPSGGTDITSQVTDWGWTVVVTAGAAVDFRAEVTPKPASPGNAAYTLNILAASQGDPSKSDLVKAVTTCTRWW